MNRPFDEAKYSALLKGLEVSEILFSELHDPYRIEAEYYGKKYLSGERLLSQRPHNKLNDITTKVSDGTHFTPEYTDSGIPFLSALNVLESRLDFSVGHQFISQAQHDELYRRCDPKPGDILLRKVGVGPRLAAVVPQDVPEFSIFVSVAQIRLKQGEIEPTLLSTFINCHYGQEQLLRLQKGASQPDLHLEDIRKLIVPIFSADFQHQIDRDVKQAKASLTESIRLYAQAESTLLRALNLENWNPPRMSTYEVRAGEAFRKGRLDAEHFHPQYEALLQHLQTHAKRCRLVQEFSSYCDRGVQPEYSEVGKYPVVNSRHILERGLDYDNFERTDEAFWNRSDTQSARIARGDILTYMTGGYSKKPGRTAVYLEDEPALASNEVNMLRARDENSIYVAVALNSFIGRLQAAAACTGSVQQHLYPSDIQNFLVPFVDASTQTQIVADVEASHIARRRAKGLLEAAKRAVEIAIEENEAAGLEYLKATI